MRYLLWLCLLCAVAQASTCPPNQPRNEAVLAQIEHAWASAVDNNDAAALACILADEFEDAGPDGQLANRAATLAKVSDHSMAHAAAHHELSDLHPHVQGDFGYIRGLATVLDGQRKTLAKVRFTDVYLYRDGRWQCVAGHESIVREKTR